MIFLTVLIRNHTEIFVILRRMGLQKYLNFSYKFLIMKLSYYTTAFVLAATLASCSAYQNAQMPDDLYYTKGPEVEEYMVMNGNAYDADASYIRSKMRNRQRFSAATNNSMNSSNFYGGMGSHFSMFPSYGFGRMGLHNSLMWGNSLGFGLGMGYGFGSLYDPFMGYGMHYPFSPFGMSHLGMGYMGGYPLGFYGGGYYGGGLWGGGYPIGYYPGGKGSAIANKPTRTFNPNQYNRNGRYNNSNTPMNGRATYNSFGNSMRNVFSPSPVNSRVNPNYRGSTYERPTRSYTNPNSTINRSTPMNNSRMSTGGSMGGGRVGGGSVGGGGGVSRPSRN